MYRYMIIVLLLQHSAIYEYYPCHAYNTLCLFLFQTRLHAYPPFLFRFVLSLFEKQDGDVTGCCERHFLHARELALDYYY